MVRSFLLEQFSACYDKNTWFVAVRNAVDGLTAEQARWKPNGSDNSIWESLSHLRFYNFAYCERFKGKTYEYPVSNNDETFTDDPSDEAWAAEIEQFDAVMNEWRELIAAAEEEKFAELVSAENPVSWVTLISNVNAHNAYHAGQILLLRKLQGNWNPGLGVS